MRWRWFVVFSLCVLLLTAAQPAAANSHVTLISQSPLVPPGPLPSAATSISQSPLPPGEGRVRESSSPLVPPGPLVSPGTVFYPGTNIPFDHFRVEDGLSQNTVRALLQDRQGYLWVGTQDGLNRYDGYSFEQFKNDPEDPNSLSFNSITALYEDTHGSIWIGTWGGGLNRYASETGLFTRYLPDFNQAASLGNAIVTSIFQDPQGRLWVGTLGGLDLFDSSTQKFTHFRNDPADSSTLSSNAISAVVPAEDGTLWIGTGAMGIAGAGLNRFDPVSGRVERIPPIGPCLQAGSISSILPDLDGSLWIANGGVGLQGGGLDHYNPATGACQHFDRSNTARQIQNDNIFYLLFDQDHRLWMASWGGGLTRMEPDNPGNFINIRHDSMKPDSLSEDTTSTLLLDRSGLLWVGTFGAGINKLNLKNLQFRTYKQFAGSISGDRVSAFAETSRGDLWVGTRDNGLYHFEAGTGVFTPYRYQSRDPASLSNNRILSLYADRDGTLWVGTRGGGLNHLDPTSGKFQHFLHDSNNPGSLISNEVNAITRDQIGRLWVATMGGLSRLEPGMSEFINYTGLSGVPISLLADGSNMWIGMWGGGVSRLQLTMPGSLSAPGQSVFTEQINLVHDATNPNSLSENSVWTIAKTSDGFVWFGTASGLNRYNPLNGEFVIFTQTDGLPNASILAIVQDESGFIWITTSDGMARYDPETETFFTFDQDDGLQGNEFSANAAFFSPSSGDIYVGGLDGFSAFDPSTLATNTTPPHVVITDFQVFNQPFPFDRGGSSAVKLNYDQNFISFNFSALDFDTPAKNTYSYRLEGFDDQWIQAGTHHDASYTNLKGGSYTFRVKAANADGASSQDEAVLRVQITPPFWQIWQFYFGLGIIGLSLVGGGIAWRYKTMRQTAQTLETIVVRRTSELRESNDQLEKEVEQRKRAEAELARRAAEELQKSEERFRAVFENAAVGVIVMTLDEHIEQINQTAMELTGYGAAEIAHLNYSILAIEEDRHIDRELFTELIEGRRDQYTVEKRYLRKDGSTFWGRVNFSAVCDADGKPLYTIGIIEDITEEKRAAERLSRQEAEYRNILEHRIAERTDELNRANELLRKKAAQDAVIAERNRLARDLHDAVTQTLFSATLIADVLPDLWKLDEQEGKHRLEELRLLTRGALAEMRTLLIELRPKTLVEVPLATLLRHLSEALTGRGGIKIHLHCEGEAILPPDVKIALYRIAQEALNNVVKHATSTRRGQEIQAVVTLNMGSCLRLTVEDNGVGFDPSVIAPDHLGLKIMRERAEGIGAKFIVYSEPGEGTQISVIWPA